MRHNCSLEKQRHLTSIITASTNYRHPVTALRCLKKCTVVSVDCVRICVRLDANCSRKQRSSVKLVLCLFSELLSCIKCLIKLEFSCEFLKGFVKRLITINKYFACGPWLTPHNPSLRTPGHSVKTSIIW